MNLTMWIIETYQVFAVASCSLLVSIESRGVGMATMEGLLNRILTKCQKIFYKYKAKNE